MGAGFVHLEADLTVLRNHFVIACRRGARRYRFNLGAVGFLSFEDGSSQEVWLVDLSEKGIGFYSDWPMERGTSVVLNLTGNLPGPLVVTAKVVHCTKHEVGDWLIGCQFTERLEAEQLAEIL